MGANHESRHPAPWWISAKQEALGAMNPTLVGLIVFACTLGGALVGNGCGFTLRKHSFSTMRPEIR